MLSMPSRMVYPSSALAVVIPSFSLRSCALVTVWFLVRNSSWRKSNSELARERSGWWDGY